MTLRGRAATWGRAGDEHRRAVDDTSVIHRTTQMWFATWGRRWKDARAAATAVRCPKTELCTIHSPYYSYCLDTHPRVMRKVGL